MMKWIKHCLAATAVVAVMSGTSWAEEMSHKMPEMAKPGPEQAWLQQFVGEWRTETEAYMPGQDAVKSAGTESVTKFGEFWIMDEVKGTMMEQPFKGLMTLGYDSEKEQFVGTWVDSMTGQLHTYEGETSEDGKILTLYSEGSCPIMSPGKISKFKEVIEIVGPNEKTYTSYIQQDSGEWMKMMTSTAYRK